MAYAQTQQARTGLFDGLFAKYADAKVESYRRGIYAKTVRNLERLSDKQLEDIGLPRAEINRRAYESVYHQKPYRV